MRVTAPNVTVVWLARPSHLIAVALRAGKGRSSNDYFTPILTNQMLLAGIRANSIHSLRVLMAMDFFLSGDRLRDHSLVSSLKERVSRSNLISQSARPGVDILSRFLNV